MTLLQAPSSMACVAWLKSLTPLLEWVDSNDITGGLKEPASQWKRDFSVTATQIAPTTTLPLRDVVCQVEVWGRPRPGDTKLPWNQVESIALIIERATLSPTNPGTFSFSGNAYLPARIAGVSLYRGVQQSRSSNSVLARASLDVLLSYHSIR